MYANGTSARRMGLFACNCARGHLPRRPAFTLLELVLGSVLMASLLVGLLLALAEYRHTRQLAINRQKAAQLADQLLASWHDSASGIPLNARGRLATDDAWWWQTSVSRRQDIFGLSSVVVRIEVMHREANQLKPLFSIETLAGMD